MKTETRKKEKETHMKSNHHASQMYQKQAQIWAAEKIQGVQTVEVNSVMVMEV